MYGACISLLRLIGPVCWDTANLHLQSICPTDTKLDSSDDEQTVDGQMNNGLPIKRRIFLVFGVVYMQDDRQKKKIRQSLGKLIWVANGNK